MQSILFKLAEGILESKDNLTNLLEVREQRNRIVNRK